MVTINNSLGVDQENINEPRFLVSNSNLSLQTESEWLEFDQIYVQT